MSRSSTTSKQPWPAPPLPCCLKAQLGFGRSMLPEWSFGLTRGVEWPCGWLWAGAMLGCVLKPCRPSRCAQSRWIANIGHQAGSSKQDYIEYVEDADTKSPSRVEGPLRRNSSYPFRGEFVLHNFLQVYDRKFLKANMAGAMFVKVVVRQLVYHLTGPKGECRVADQHACYSPYFQQLSSESWNITSRLRCSEI